MAARQRPTAGYWLRVLTGDETAPADWLARNFPELHAEQRLLAALQSLPQAVAWHLIDHVMSTRSVPGEGDLWRMVHFTDYDPGADVDEDDDEPLAPRRRRARDVSFADLTLEERYELRHTALSACESPIEVDLAFGLVSAVIHSTRWRRSDLRFARPIAADEGIYVRPQAWIGDNRADFFVMARRNGRETRLVVECDGEEFHSAPDQVARDRQRDARMKAKGIDAVMRFRGSDIRRDAEQCGCDVLSAIDRGLYGDR